MGEIKNYWKIIDTFLKKYSPETYETLAPPASQEEIDNLINTVGLPIPDSLIESLLIHNGQIDKNWTYPFLDYQRLLSCSEIIDTYKMMKGLFSDEDKVYYIDESSCKIVKRNFIWNNRWMLFTDSNGDGLMIDFTPAPFGKVGQIIYRPNSDSPPDIALADSYGDWLKNIVSKLEKGEFQMEDGMIKLDNFTFDW